MQRSVFLRSSKVCLVPLDLDRHVKNIQRWKNNPTISCYLSTIPPITHEFEHETLSLAMRDPTQRVFAVETPRWKHVGFTDLHEIKFNEGTAHSGSLIGEERGHGLGTHAKMLLLRYAFHHLGLRKIYAKVIEGNIPCLKHLATCGYREEARLKRHYFREGSYRDQHILSLFREDFDPLWEKFQASK